MARAKKLQQPSADEVWAQYFAVQLTPEEKAAARAEAQRMRVAPGAAELFRRLQGKVHLVYDLDELREDRD
jgi:hypothetical protein